MALTPLPAMGDEAGYAARDIMQPASGAPAVDPATGIASVLLPIEAPPGRHGLQPALALRYNSAARRSNAGAGFSLELGSVERSTRFGPPRFDDADTFVLRLDGAEYDLFPIDDAGVQYRTVVETGFLVARLSPGPGGPGSSYWVARGRDGRSYRFGFHNDLEGGDFSQIDDFKWGLDRVEDAAGNVLEARYYPSGRNLFLIRVDYASHPSSGLLPSNTVEICWERQGHFGVTPAGESTYYRLASIRTTAGGRTARAWTFRYNVVGGSTIGWSCAPAVFPGPTEPAPSGNGPGSNAPKGRGGGSRRIEMEAIARPALGGPGSLIGDAGSLQTTATDASLSSASSVPDNELPPHGSRLAAVERTDGDGRTLPPITYDWTPGEPFGWGPPASWAPPLPFVANSDVDQDPGVRMIDLNRDGLPDMIQMMGRCDGACAVTRAVYLNTGSGFVLDPGWTASLDNVVRLADPSRSAWFVLKHGTNDTIDNGVRFLDINDDGFPDLVRLAKYFDAGLRKGVHLNTGSGFTADVSGAWPLPNEPFVAMEEDPSRDVAEDLGVRIADVNGDGRSDLMVSRGEWGGSLTRRVYLYDGGQYRLDNRWLLPDEPFVRHIDHGRWIDMGLRVMELNGDGWADLFVAANVNGVVRNAAYLNTRRPGGPSPTWEKQSGWLLDPATPDAFVNVSSSGDGYSHDRGLRVVRIGAASRNAIIMARSWNGNPDEKRLWVPSDGGWSSGPMPYFPALFVIKRPDRPPRDQGVRLADVDGDSGTDVVIGLQVGTREWRRCFAWLPHVMLASASNGLGGTTALTYAPAPHGGAVEGGGPAALPMPLAVVAASAVSDGMGRTYTTRYEYDGAYYHHAAREFRGFRTVRTFHPGGEQMVESLHHQQPALRAAPLRGAPERSVTRRASDGAVFSRTTWSYDTADAVPPLSHPAVRTETALFEWTVTDPESDAAVFRTATTMSHDFDRETHPPDRILRRRTEVRLGDLDDPADDRTIVEEFAAALDDAAPGGPTAGRWFLDLPAHRAVAGADGNIVSESWTLYDDQPLGAVGAAGLPTVDIRRGGPPGPPGSRAPEHRDNPRVVRSYDRYGNLESEVDPLGRERRFAHGLTDPTFTFPDSETDPLGRVTTRTFDPRTGLPASIVDPNGGALRTLYDGFGRKLLEYGPFDTETRPTVSYRYDDAGPPSRVFRYARETSGEGETAGTLGCLETITFFDGLGRPLETRAEAAGGRSIVTRAVTFDASGRIAAEAEPFAVPGSDDYVPPGDAPHTRRFVYDPAGRLVASIDAAENTRREEHFGLVTTLTDAGGHRRELRRDAFGGVVRVDEFEGAAVSWRAASSATYAYDAAGRTVRVVDPSGAAAAIAHDTLGHRVGLDDPHTGSWRYEYDLGGSLVREIDPAGRVTTMTYDPLGRLVDRIYADGRHDRWNYDEGGAAAAAFGRLTSIVDPSGAQRFAYDRLGRVIETARTLDGVTYAVTTAFDALGRAAEVTLPGGRTIRYAYDEGGNLESLQPYATDLAYDDRGFLVRAALQAGVIVTREHEAATGRPARLLARRGDGETLLDLLFQHDPDGLVASIQDDTVPGAPRLRSFAYDGRHRLTRAVVDGAVLDYVFDDAGNLTSKEGQSYTYGVPARSQWLSATSAGETFLYDALGNVVARRSAAADWTYTYDAAGRIVAMAEAAGGLRVTHDYDASGLRVREVTDDGTRRSVLLTPMPQVEVRDGALSLHVFAGGLRIAILEASGRTLFPVTDFLGSTRLVVDDAGAVVSRHDYLTYGGRPAGAPPAPVTTTFAGGLEHPGTGLLLMGHRFYDPSLGRFVQPDALVADRFDPQGFNRYAYARNNPVNLADPEGRFTIAPFLVAGAVALLGRQARADVGTSVALTAATIFLTGALGPGVSAGIEALKASQAALYAAAVSTALLHTPLGQGMVQGSIEVLRELGVAPRTATIAGATLTTMFLNSSLQRGFATALAKNGEAVAGEAIGDHGAADAHLAARGATLEQYQPKSGDIYGTPLQGGPNRRGEWIDIERYSTLVGPAGESIGIFGTHELALGFEHGAVGFTGGGVAVRYRHWAYLLGGVSTQQFTRELFLMGYSGTLFTLTGRASDFLVEFIYGPYGGGLAVGVHQGRLAGAAAGEPGP